MRALRLPLDTASAHDVVMSGPFDPNSLTMTELVGDAVASVSPDATLHEVADVLCDGGFGAVVVGDGSTPDGLVSERDLVRALSERYDPATTTAAQLAATDLRWVAPGATVAEVASEMMNSWVRHLLVGTDGTLIGIVSARDIIGAYAAADDQLG